MGDAQESRPTHVIGIGNQKGGVGKSTNTVHIATALAELGRRCLIFDLDSGRGATRHFGIESDGFLGSFEVLVGDENPESVVLATGEGDVELPPNVNLIPARRNLERLPQVLATREKWLVPHDILLGPIQKLRGKYDYIFLDTAPTFTPATLAAYKASDWFILSTMPEQFAIDGLNDALADLLSAQKRANPNLRLLGVILCANDARTRLAQTLSAYLDKTFAVPGQASVKFKTNISRSTVVGVSQREGKTIFQTHPDHKVTHEYRALAQEIEERIRAALAAPSEAHAPAESETVAARGEVANG